MHYAAEDGIKPLNAFCSSTGLELVLQVSTAAILLHKEKPHFSQLRSNTLQEDSFRVDKEMLVLAISLNKSCDILSEFDCKYVGSVTRTGCYIIIITRLQWLEQP